MTTNRHRGPYKTWKKHTSPLRSLHPPEPPSIAGFRRRRSRRRKAVKIAGHRRPREAPWHQGFGPPRKHNGRGRTPLRHGLGSELVAGRRRKEKPDPHTFPTRTHHHRIQTAASASTRQSASPAPPPLRGAMTADHANS
jgi:hypothetical protein